MATFGALGKLSFKVSDEQTRTFSNFQWSGSARYGTHQRHGGNALTEFTGLEPDQISLDATFNAQLGTSPIDEITQLWQWQRKGTTLPLTIGSHAYGRYRWTIVSLSIKAQYFDRNGDIYHAVVTIKLQEYLRK